MRTPLRSAILVCLVLLTWFGGATVRIDVPADDCCAEGQCCCQAADTGCCGSKEAAQGPVLVAGCGCGHGGAHFVGPILPRAVAPVRARVAFSADPRTWIVPRAEARPSPVDLETEAPVPRA